VRFQGRLGDRVSIFVYNKSESLGVFNILSMKRKITFIEKFFTSAIDVLLVFLISPPFLFIWGFNWQWKLLVIGIFFLYNVLFLVFNNNRCPGMILMKTNWAQ
jgi:hypothetical protein